MKKTKTILAGAAVAGLIMGSAATSLARNVSESQSGVQIHTMSDKGTHSCKGQNSCKGEGGCKANPNGCKGKNDCKGKGGCATDGSKP